MSQTASGSFLPIIVLVLSFISSASTAYASGCRSTTPKLSAAIKSAEERGFRCTQLDLTFSPEDLNNDDMKLVLKIYKEGLVFLKDATVDRSVQHLGANFEKFYYEGGPLPSETSGPYTIRVPKLKINFTYQEKTTCEKFDEKTGLMSQEAIDATINVRGVIGLVGVCRSEVSTAKTE